MPRDGTTGNYTLPTVYEAVPGEDILAVQHNTPLEDIAATLNDATPVTKGGTGATTVANAQSNLGIVPARIPETFGAVGDGVADDTTALKAMIADAGIDGVMDFQPNRTYNFESPIETLDGQIMNLNGATLKGLLVNVGQETTIRDGTITNPRGPGILDFRGQGGSRDNLRILNCLGPGYVFGGVFRSQVAWSSMSDITIRSCNFGMAVCTSDSGLICYVREGFPKNIGIITNGGSGYNNGWHFVQVTGGSGARAWAVVEVSGGSVTSFTPVISGHGFVSGDIIGISALSLGTGTDFAFSVADLLDVDSEPLERNWANANRLTAVSIRQNNYSALYGNGPCQYNFWFGFHTEGNNPIGDPFPEIDLEMRSNAFFGAHIVGSHVPIGTPIIRERPEEGTPGGSNGNVYYGCRIVHQSNTDPEIDSVYTTPGSVSIHESQVISNAVGGYDLVGTICDRKTSMRNLTTTGDFKALSRVSISAAVPNLSLNESDTNTYGRHIISLGIYQINVGGNGAGESGGGQFRLAGYGATDISEASVRRNGSWQRILSRGTIPVTSTDPGEPGEIGWDTSHVYVCVAPNLWRRLALDAF